MRPRGAYVMGRNMFGPIRGEWDEDWSGWWGPEPPYHAPVFVLTHHAHEPIEMEGGTTFHFVTDGFDAAYAQARGDGGRQRRGHRRRRVDRPAGADRRRHRRADARHRARPARVGRADLRRRRVLRDGAGRGAALAAGHAHPLPPRGGDRCPSPSPPSRRSPDGGKGLGARHARALGARGGRPAVRGPPRSRSTAKKEPAHLALHPFGLIPTYEEGDLALFETGAIVLHIAERHAGLLPDDPNARARAITWMFAAVNTVEPPILELVNAKIFEGDKPWAAERLPLVEDRVRDRLRSSPPTWATPSGSTAAFSAGDLMMVSVLLRLRPRASSTSSRTWPPTSPAARRGPPTSGRSPRNWRSTPRNAARSRQDCKA